MQIKVGELPGSFRFQAISALFITGLITSNIIAVKLANFWGYVLPSAIIIFPVTYIIGDILTEVYGYKVARKVIWFGFVCNLFAVVSIWIAGMLDPVSQDLGEAYQLVLGSTYRILLASFLAYLAGELLNAFVLAKLKSLTEGRWLWLRTISSTIFGQGVDTAIFISLAFGGSLPAGILLNIVFLQWGAKVLYEAVATPFTYLIVGNFKRAEGMDVYDDRLSIKNLLTK